MWQELLSTFHAVFPSVLIATLFWRCCFYVHFTDELTEAWRF